MFSFDFCILIRINGRMHCTEPVEAGYGYLYCSARSLEKIGRPPPVVGLPAYLRVTYVYPYRSPILKSEKSPFISPTMTTYFPGTNLPRSTA